MQDTAKQIEILEKIVEKQQKEIEEIKAQQSQSSILVEAEKPVEVPKDIFTVENAKYQFLYAAYTDEKGKKQPTAELLKDKESLKAFIEKYPNFVKIVK